MKALAKPAAPEEGSIDLRGVVGFGMLKARASVEQCLPSPGNPGRGVGGEGFSWGARKN